MICPKCKEEITHLDFDISAGCSAQMWEEDVKADKPSDYDLSCLTDGVTYDNFRCPECDETLALNEEEAIKLLKK